MCPTHLLVLSFSYMILLLSAHGVFIKLSSGMSCPTFQILMPYTGILKKSHLKHFPLLVWHLTICALHFPLLLLHSVPSYEIL